MIVAYELRARLEEFYADYVETLDQGRIEAWPDFFAADCTYKLIPRENHEAGYEIGTMYYESRDMLRDRVVTVQKTLMYAPRYLRHLVSNIRVHADDGKDVTVHANYAVFETLLHQPTRVFNVGRYIDTLVREGDSFLIKSRLAVFDSELVPNSVVYPV